MLTIGFNNKGRFRVKTAQKEKRAAYMQEYLKEYYAEHKEELTEYKRRWYYANKARAVANGKRWRLDNRERVVNYGTWYRENNREKLAAKRVVDREYIAGYGKEWRKRNPEKRAVSSSKARANRKKAVPVWLTTEQWGKIENWYMTAQAMARGAFPSVSRDEYVIDHIVPLRGHGVCGLHVPWNLQILTAEENLRKHNYLPTDEHMVNYAANGYNGVRRKLLLAARRAA